MKPLLSVLLVIALIFIVYIAVCATIGILLRCLIILAIASLLVGVVNRHLNSRKQDSDLARSHRRAEKAADRKLKEIERNINI